MVSQNAFKQAAASNGYRAESVAVECSHAAKRQKLEELEANIHSKIADPETALEVDHMILDYLAYQTTAATIASRKSEQSSSISLESNLAMTDKFLDIFKANHPSFSPDEALRFRLLLLKFSTLFTRRLRRDHTVPLPPSLKAMREANRRRAILWTGDLDRLPSRQHDVAALDSELPLAQNSLERNRAHVLNALDAPAEDEAYEDAFYGTSDSLALLDILPSFMALSAARKAISNGNLTEQWMHLAGNFMLQACLEQYLVRGVDGSDAVDEAFAWGFKPDGIGEQATLGDRAGNEKIIATDNRMQSEINDMFKADDNDDDDNDPTEVRDWTEIRSVYLAELLSMPGTMDLSSHLESVASSHSVRTFENSILAFLAALSASMSTPVLLQLEGGNLDGFEASDTQRFLHSCGLAHQWPST